MDVFRLQNPITKLHYLTIGHDNKGRAPGWYVTKITVMRLDKKHRRRLVTYRVHRWLATNRADKKIVLNLKSTSSVIIK